MKLGQLHTLAATPQSFSSSSWAAIDSRRMVPEPSNCTCGVFAVILPAAGLHRYMPLMIWSSVPAVRPGMA
ncbi:hypothetical protein D9M69_700390 [compost metagenome]